jgi:hypothetical protein
MVDTKLAETIPYGGVITEQSTAHPQQAFGDSRRCNFVRQSVEPPGELDGQADIKFHVVFRRQTGRLSMSTLGRCRGEEERRGA